MHNNENIRKRHNHSLLVIRTFYSMFAMKAVIFDTLQLLVDSHLYIVFDGEKAT